MLPDTLPEPAETVPKTSECFTRSILDALSKQFCVLDAAGNILDISKPWLDFEREHDGGKPALQTGQNYLALLDAGLAIDRGGKAFADGIRSVLNGTSSFFSLAYPFRTSSGQLWFSGKAILFPDQEQGRMIVIHENISEYQHLENRFRQAVESAPNAIVMVNESGRIVMVNAQTELSFGYSRAEMIGQAVEMLVPERFRAGHIDYRQAYLADPVSRPMGAGRELFGLRKDGSEFPVEIGLALIDSHDETLVLSSIVDITERRNASDKLKQTLNEKEMLLKEVYHREKNNLQVVSSLINLQARSVNNEETADLLKQSADRIKAMALLHEKLYHSKDLAKIDFNDYIRSLVDHLLFGYGAHTDKITLNMNIDKVFLGVDTAIPCGLIINELLSNALKHAFPGDRRGEIGITFTRDQGEYVLTIADNGVGLPDELDFKKSSSLGLQLVDTLTNQLMGKMSLDRTNGSAFTLRFAEIS
ncbi:MAG: sensor histidine kinase [Methylomonas sp.]